MVAGGQRAEALTPSEQRTGQFRKTPLGMRNWGAIKVQVQQDTNLTAQSLCCEEPRGFGT